MKGKRIQSTREYQPNEKDIFLLDTNVLIKLFYPMDFSNKNDEYSDFFSKILKAKSKILLTAIQVSEFINRCIRFQYKL